MRDMQAWKQKHLRPAAVAAVAAAGLLLCIGVTMWVRHGPGLDPNAIDSAQKPLTADEIQEQIQKEADEGAFRFKMNTAPNVTTRKDPQNGKGGEIQVAYWYITNSIDNASDMTVVITETDGTELYKSRQLKPGEQELSGPLEKKLEPGQYEATAVASAIDPESGDTVGSVTTEITLNVQAEN